MASRKDNKGRVLRDGESQRKGGRYQYRYNDNLGKRKYVYANTLDVLREKEKEIQTNILNGLDFEAGQMTTMELLDYFMTMKRNITERTRRNYTNAIKRVGRSNIAGRRICDIKVMDCKRFTLWLQDQGYKFGTIQETCNVLKAAFKLAYEEDAIRKNPMNFKLVDYLEDDTKEILPLTPDETASLLSFVKNDIIAKKHLDLITILLETGVRMGELTGITTKDVDMKKRVVHINKQIQRKKGELVITDPKSDAGLRTIPLSDSAYKAFQNVLEKRKQFRMEPMLNGHYGFVFLSSTGNIKPPADYNKNITCIMERYNKAHPETPIYLTPHVFRHTFCTNMVYAGLDIKSLQYVMGHANATMILKVYAHVDKTRAVEAMRDIIAQ